MVLANGVDHVRFSPARPVEESGRASHDALVHFIFKDRVSGRYNGVRLAGLLQEHLMFSTGKSWRIVHCE